VTEANSLPQNRFAMNHRHASSQAGLDNGSGSWQVKTSSVWFYLSNGCRTRNPAALTAGFHLFPPLMTRYFVQPAFDDRTDDCAFGAMMSLASGRKFRKLRFQMIALPGRHQSAQPPSPFRARATAAGL
jgi:hypothetical protein